MRKSVRLFMVFSFVAICGSVLAAENDPRLSKHITMDCVNVRLHTAVERIAKDTGVTIRIGSNSDDWRVRDIPVLVCARDISLGVLLQSIADANHLLLSRNKSADEIAYRIWRDAKRKNDLDAYEQAKAAAKVASAKYDWDAMALLKGVPETELEDKYATFISPPAEGRLTATRARLASNLMSELGDGARDRVLAGDSIVMGLPNTPESLKPHLVALFDSFNQTWTEIASKPVNTDNLNQYLVHVRLDPYNPSTPAHPIVEIQSNGRMIQIDCGKFACVARKYYADSSPRPDMPAFEPKWDALDRGYQKLAFPEKGGPAFLDAKVNVEAPKDVKYPSYPELLAGLSKATQYSIVAEGNAARYRGRQMSSDECVSKLFGREVAVREVLEAGAGQNGMEWYVDEQHKLIVGREKQWIDRLHALVPEKLLTQMSDKLNGKGIDLDDLAPLAGMSANQVNRWIRDSQDYPGLGALQMSALSVCKDSVWSLYFALKPSERAKAKSGTPVPLAGFDRGSLCSALRQQVSQHAYSTLAGGAYPADKAEAIYASLLPFDSFTDRDSLPDMTLRVESIDQSVHKVAKGTAYLLHVEGPDGGNPKIVQQVSGYYPILAPKPKDEPAKRP